MSNQNRKEELIDLVAYAQDGYGFYEKQLKELEAIYFAEMDEETKKFLEDREKSSLFFNKSQAKCNTSSFSLLKNYFSNDKFASVEADNEDETYVSIARAIEKESKAQLKNIKYFSALLPGLYKLPYVGTIITRTYWAGKIVVEDIGLDDFYFDRDAKSQDDVRYCVHDVYVAIEDIKRMQRDGIYDRSFNIDELISDADAKAYTRVKLQEIYTKVGEEWKVSTIYDNTHFFRLDVVLNDGLPFNWGGLSPQLKRLDEDNYIANYYQPFISVLKPLQIEYNMRRNQIIDGLKQQLSPKLLVPKNTGINPLDLSKPSGCIPVAIPTSIQIVPAANVSGAMADVQMISQEMNEISSMPDILNGVSMQKNKTAKQVGIEASSGGVKLDIDTRTLNETFFEPQLKRVCLLSWKYAESDNFMGVDRTVDPKLKITFNTGLGVTNDVVKTELLDSSFMKMQQLLDNQLALRDPDASKTLNGMKELLRESLTVSGIKDADEYLGEKKELGEVSQLNQPPMPQEIGEQ